MRYKLVKSIVSKILKPNDTSVMVHIYIYIPQSVFQCG